MTDELHELSVQVELAEGDEIDHTDRDALAEQSRALGDEGIPRLRAVLVGGANEFDGGHQLLFALPRENLDGELLAVSLRYKQPEGDESRLLTFQLTDSELTIDQSDRDFRWASSVAQFGMLLRHSQHAGTSTWQKLLHSAESAAGPDPDATRAELLGLIEMAHRLSGGKR